MEREPISPLQLITLTVLTSMVSIGLGYYSFIEPRLAALEATTQTERSAPDAVSAASTIPDVVENTVPAVVSIVITADVPIIEQYYDDRGPFSWFGWQVPRQRQIGTERQEIGGGTGFFVSADGYLITNRHVVDQEGVDYTVVTNDGTTYDVEVVAKDPTLDVAVLKVESDEAFPYLTFADATALRLGETVIAIGNALAEFPNSVSTGVISGLSRNIVASSGWRAAESLEGVIQTDAAINRGNSGGPLLNLAGQVVGVNVAASGAENIGFALPSDVVNSVFESVLEHGEIVRPFLGIRYLPVTPELAARNNLPVDYGILIVRGETRADLAIIPGSAADKAGLEENDIILEIEGTKIEAGRSLGGLLREYAVGDTIELRVLHDGREETIPITLEAQP